MAEKSALINSIPPVSRTDKNSTGSPFNGGSESDLGTTSAVEVVESDPAVTPLQNIAYASYAGVILIALVVGLVGLASVSRAANLRFKAALKVFSLGALLTAGWAVFVGYLFSRYLNEATGNVPLLQTIALWVVLGSFSAFALRALLVRSGQSVAAAGFVDALIYGFIFALSAFGVSQGIQANAALVITILAVFLMILPMARSYSAFRVARTEHVELINSSDQLLINSFLILPAFVPVLAFAYVCGLSTSLVLLLSNTLAILLLLIGGFTLIASAKAAPRSRENTIAESSAPKSLPKVAASGTLEDPIIQFLNEEKVGNVSPTAKEDARVTNTRSMPAKKIAKPKIPPPQKPKSKSPSATKPAPNAPRSVKAPAKPKKRI